MKPFCPLYVLLGNNPRQGGDIALIVLLMRLLVIALLVYFVLFIIRYVRNPKRKLMQAKEQNEFYVVDEAENVRKNLELTYKGVLFEGEKYINEQIFSITMLLKNPDQLNDLTHEDIRLVSAKVSTSYPKAIISWKSPVREFLKNEPQKQ